MAKRRQRERQNQDNFLVQLTPRARESIARYLGGGLGKKWIVERVLRFFGESPEPIQRILMDDVPRTMEREYLEYFKAWVEDRLVEQASPASEMPHIPKPALPPSPHHHEPKTTM